MGCSMCHELQKNEESLKFWIVKCLKKNNLRDLKKLLSNSEVNFIQKIDEVLTKVKNIELNALGVALWHGKVQTFDWLLKQGASLKAMEELLNRSELSGLGVVCCLGHLNLLEYYLPIWLDSPPLTPGTHENTIDFEDQTLSSPTFKPYTPIQLACFEGHIHIVNYLVNYFKNTKPPQECDLNWIDEYTGENCALIACRKPSLSMIKFLYENCNADFQLKNKNEENAIQIAAAASKKSENTIYLEIIRYLVEFVEIDPTYRYEETLLLTDCRSILNYIERKLKLFGIEARKEEIEDTNRIKVPPRTQLYSETEDLTLEHLKDTKSVHSFLSEISHTPSRNETPFTSVFEK